MPDTLVTIASYILPLFAMIVLIRCMRSMLGNKTQTEIWGYIHKDDGVALINHWENLDEFEGAEFERTAVTVERYDELEVDTYIYTLKAEIITMYEDK